MMKTDKVLFFCIGAEKAGTTWLYHQFYTRPDFHVPVKEVKYFHATADGPRKDVILGQRIVQVKEQIERLIAKRKDGKGPTLESMSIWFGLLDLFNKTEVNDANYLEFMTRNVGEKSFLCDFSPVYAIVSRVEFSRMTSLSETCRFLFLLRDPVDRLWSSIRMNMNDDQIDDDQFEVACLRQLEKIISKGPLQGPHRSNYIHTFNELESVVVGKDRKVLFYETMFNDVTFESICRFVGVEPFRAEFDDKRFVGRQSSLPLDLFKRAYAWLADQYDYAAKRFGDDLPQRWRDQMAKAQS